jgi:uncharacterized protein
MRTSARHGRHAAGALALAGSLAAFGVAPAALAAQQPAQPDLVHAQGMGSVEVEPDQALLVFAVETLAPTAREASRQNATRMDAVVQALIRAGVPRERIRTVGFDLHPQYAHDRPTDPRQQQEPPRIIGYRATNRAQLRVDDVAGVGTLIDAGIAAGANRVEGLHFTVRNPEAARQQALRQAVEAARAEAAVVAAALGRTLGAASRVDIGGVHMPPPRPMMARAGVEMDMALAPTPIEPGRLNVTAHVSAAFRLEP